jgi:hypothetical protein
VYAVFSAKAVTVIAPEVYAEIRALNAEYPPIGALHTPVVDVEEVRVVVPIACNITDDHDPEASCASNVIVPTNVPVIATFIVPIPDRLIEVPLPVADAAL